MASALFGSGPSRFGTLVTRSALSIREVDAHGFFRNWHSHMRNTLHPRFISNERTRRSLALFASILWRHASELTFGERFLPQAWPRQNKPSTKTTKLRAGQTK